MKIYTRTGDDGTTGLIGGGRVRKCDPRIEFYGTGDELNAVLGLAAASPGAGGAGASRGGGAPRGAGGGPSPPAGPAPRCTCVEPP